MPKSCQNGNESTFWQNKWQLVHIQTQERETDPYTHEHIIILSIHTCMSIIDTLHIHTHMTIDPLSTHTHIMSIDHLHTYEHMHHPYTHEHILTWTTYRDERPIARKMERRGARVDRRRIDERPETSSITYVTSKASFTC